MQTFRLPEYFDQENHAGHFSFFYNKSKNIFNLHYKYVMYIFYLKI